MDLQRRTSHQPLPSPKARPPSSPSLPLLRYVSTPSAGLQIVLAGDEGERFVSWILCVERVLCLVVPPWRFVKQEGRGGWVGFRGDIRGGRGRVTWL